MMAYICTYGLWHLYKVLRNWWRGKEVSIRITERQKKQKNVKCFVWIREIWQKTKKTHTPENRPEVFDFSSVRIEWEHKQIKPFKWTSSPVCEQVDASSFVQLSPRAAQKANHYLWCTESWLFRTTVMTQCEQSGQQQWSHFFFKFNTQTIRHTGCVQSKKNNFISFRHNYTYARSKKTPFIYNNNNMNSVRQENAQFNYVTLNLLQYRNVSEW